MHPASPRRATSERFVHATDRPSERGFAPRDADLDRVQLSVVEDDGPAGGRQSVGVGSTDVASFAREVWGSSDPLERLQRGVVLAVELVAGSDHAATSAMVRRRTRPGPATDAVGQAADQLQQDLQQGPRLEVVRTGGTVISQDLTRERRWKRWSPQVVDELGVRAALSIVLFDGTQVLGSLSLYSRRADAWSSSAVAVAQVVATHLSLAFGDGLQIEHRGRAMESRTLIGQAQGILMERFTLTADAAHAVLLRRSQQEHVKIVVVAADLVRTAGLPVGDR